MKIRIYFVSRNSTAVTGPDSGKGRFTTNSIIHPTGTLIIPSVTGQGITALPLSVTTQSSIKAVFLSKTD
jgi:hypothetical protein